MIRSILLYGLECKILTSSELTSLERFQNKVIRWLSRCHACVTKVSNADLRRILKVPSIYSVLRHRRLGFLRPLLREDHGCMAVRAALWGRYPWEPHGIRIARLNLFGEDLSILCQRGDFIFLVGKAIMASLAA